MNSINKVIASLQAPVEVSSRDLAPTKVQVIVDRAQCSPLTSLALRKLADTPGCLIYDKSKLKVTKPRGLSSTHACRWLNSRLKKQGTEENYITTLVLYCPDGHHVPVSFIENLQRGQLVVGQMVKLVRVDNIVLIHAGLGFYREWKPARVALWLCEGADTDTEVIPQEELRKIIYCKKK